jgi:hypothetical protein
MTPFWLGRCSVMVQRRSDGVMKEVLTLPASRDGYAPQENKDLTIGYYALPVDVSVFDPSFVGLL